MGRIASAWLLALAMASVLRAQIPTPPKLFEEDGLPAPKKFDPPLPKLIEAPPPVVDIPAPPPIVPPKAETPPKIETPEISPQKPPVEAPPDAPKPFAKPGAQVPKPPVPDAVPFAPPTPMKLPAAPAQPQVTSPRFEAKSPPTPPPPITMPVVVDSPPLNFVRASTFEKYRVWAGADFELWWFQKNPIAVPLAVTTTSPAIPGSMVNILNVDPNARFIIGQQQQNPTASNGARVWIGAWLDDVRSLGVEVSGMWIENSDTVGAVFSNAGGSPIYSRPVAISGGSAVYDISFPGFLAGSFNVQSHQFLRGVEANFVGFLVGREELFFDIIAGARFLNFDDQLDLRQQSTNLVPMPAFGMNLLAPGTVVNAVDTYHATNNFYGGQIGGRLEKTFGRLSVSMTGKVALGVNDMALTVGGATTRSDTMATYTGGILANSANIGRFTESHFAVVPEGSLSIGWWFTPNFRAKIGYNVLYISDVVRAGTHISNSVNPGAVPVDPSYGLIPVTRMPVPLTRTDFWAEGITFGIDFRY